MTRPLSCHPTRRTRPRTRSLLPWSLLLAACLALGCADQGGSSTSDTASPADDVVDLQDDTPTDTVVADVDAVDAPDTVAPRTLPSGAAPTAGGGRTQSGRFGLTVSVAAPTVAVVRSVRFRARVGVGIPQLAP